MGRKYFKYIIWDLGMLGEFPVVFPTYVQHADLRNVYDQNRIVAAGNGEVYTEDGKIKIVTFGNSISLSTKEKTIGSREQDSKILLVNFVGEEYR